MMRYLIPGVFGVAAIAVGLYFLIFQMIPSWLG